MKQIKTRILLIFVNSFFLILGFLFFVLIATNQLKQTAINQTVTNLKIISRSVESFLQNNCIHSINNNENDYDSLLKNFAFSNEDFRISLVDLNGKVIADSDAKQTEILENHLNRSEIISAIKEKPEYALRKSTVNQKYVLYFARKITLKNNYENKPHEYVLRLSMPLETSVYFSSNVKAKFLFSGIIIFSVIIILSILISNFVVKGIEELKNTSKKYEKNDFDYEPKVSSTKEINDLAKQLKQMAFAIKSDRQRLNHLEQVRKDFVANVSHELKTPITSIKGFSETLLEGAIEDSECAKNFVEIIAQQSCRMEQIIEDLLTLSRLEQENKTIDLYEIDLVCFLRDLVKKEQMQNKKQMVFNFLNKTEKEKLYFSINENLFCQAISNILQNASKYCPEKSLVECILEKPSNSKSKIKIIIQDNGNGIPLEYKSRIFERFFRVDKGRSRETGGTGLGLAIVKHIINLHGGTINEVGRIDGQCGSRFEIEI